MVSHLKLIYPQVEELFRRYDNTSKSVVFSFVLAPNLLVKIENEYGYLHFDIRKYCTIKDQSVPTRVGVRFRGDSIPLLKSALEVIMDESKNNAVKITEKCMLALVFKEVELMNSLQKPFCEGCKVNHSSQTEHMGEYGCLSVSQPTTVMKVDGFFQEAVELITDAECLELAEKVAKEMKVPLICPVVPEKNSELKAILLENIENPDALMKMVNKIV